MWSCPQSGKLHGLRRRLGNCNKRLEKALDSINGIQDQRRRRSVLRSENRLPSGRLHRSYLAVRYHQLDFQMPERFDLSYIGADGEKHRPVMIQSRIRKHRTFHCHFDRAFCGAFLFGSRLSKSRSCRWLTNITSMRQRFKRNWRQKVFSRNRFKKRKDRI